MAAISQIPPSNNPDSNAAAALDSGHEPPRREHKSASVLLREIVQAVPNTEVSIGDLTSGLSDRAWGIVNLLFALPNCVPLPPGVGSAFGLPMIFLGWQMAMGRPTPWLPRFIAERKLEKAKLLEIIDKVEPQLKKLEKICKPRLHALTGARAERWLGALICICGIAVALPGPGSNFIPSIGVVILSLGLIEDDGLFILGGIIFSIIACGIAALAVAVFVGLLLQGAAAVLS